MVHHWRASDGAIPTENPSEQMLFDRGRLIGYMEHGRVNGRSAWRGVLESGQVVGYSWTLEQCCTDFWNWYILFVKYPRARQKTPCSPAQGRTTGGQK